MASNKNETKLLIASNRLPVTISKDKDGEYHFKMSSGGLVSALSGAKKQMNFTWIGWPGVDIPEDERELVTKRLMDEYSCLPVYLSDELADRHYNGFSNSILWPLFHYHPAEIVFDDLAWDAYRQCNMSFAEAIRKEIGDEDSLVWVQDYHLMLVPKMLRALIEGKSPAPGQGLEEVGKPLRKKSRTSSESSSRSRRTVDDRWMEAPSPTPGANASGPRVTLGFFLHTPFPSSEIYRILPVRREILLGILDCDLIGFHTYDYARHFLSSCTRILGLPTMPNGVEHDNGRYCHVGTFPIGIDPSQFLENLETPKVQKRIEMLERRFKDVKVIVGVDRLDYIKGVPQKLHALEVFLSEHPEWIGKVVLAQVAVPSRQDVEEYQNLRASVNELVGRINGRFGTVEFMPIHFMHRSIPFDELCALYAVGDACIVTSTRDGMNLVSYEYIACQQKRHGAMILSEFTGAAHSLNGSIIVNPWNTEELANGIHEAMTMEPALRQQNHKKLFQYVSKFTALHWGTTFVAELQKLAEEPVPPAAATGPGSSVPAA